MSAEVFKHDKSSKYQVFLNRFDLNDYSVVPLISKQLNLELLVQIPDSILLFTDELEHTIFKYSLSKDVEYIKFANKNRLVLRIQQVETECICIQFTLGKCLDDFTSKLKDIKYGKTVSLFDQRTEESSATQYFQFYAYLSQQQNMMQDYIRTSTYQRAIFENYQDFSGKIVLDVGAGSGILSFFAAHAGAKRVYAIEASSMAQHANILVNENKMKECIRIVAGKIEEIELPELVDVIVSEPMGYMLFNERMLESFIHAKKFLKPDGKMYPTQGDLYVAPFSDEALYMEQVSKANFWSQTSFYGIDLSSLKQQALDEYFKQPIVDTFDIRICIAKPVKHSVNFLSACESDLYNINIDLKFDVNAPVVVHGLAFWFDVVFMGSFSHIWLSTSPTQPLTHWYQVRCLLPQPFLVNQPSTLVGHAILKANKKQSYDIEILLTCNGTNLVFKNTLDLKNPFFRYTGQTSVPPGQYNESPTEQYYQQLTAQSNSVQQQQQQQQQSHQMQQVQPQQMHESQ